MVRRNRRAQDQVEITRRQIRGARGLFWRQLTAKVPEVSVGSTKRRSRMPVRVRIHSSEVSTKFVNQSFGTTRSGTLLPVPMIAAAIDPFIRRSHTVVVGDERRPS